MKLYNAKLSLHKLAALSALCAGLFQTGALFAQSIWSGAGGDGRWINPNNWAGGFPNSAVDVYMGPTNADPQYSFPVTLGDSAAAGNLTINAAGYQWGNELANGTLVVHGNLTLVNGLLRYTESEINVLGSLIINKGGEMAADTGNAALMGKLNANIIQFSGGTMYAGSTVTKGIIGTGGIFENISGASNVTINTEAGANSYFEGDIGITNLTVNGSGRQTFIGISSNAQFYGSVAVNDSARLTVGDLKINELGNVGQNAVLEIAGRVEIASTSAFSWQSMQGNFAFDLTEGKIAQLTLDAVDLWEGKTIEISADTLGTYDIIVWDYDQSGFFSNGGASDMVYDGDVQGYFQIGENGKTLQFVVTGLVPEPSTYAAVFGALALAFAAYRRRK